MKWIWIMPAFLFVITGCRLQDKFEDFRGGAPEDGMENEDGAEDLGIRADLLTIRRRDVASEKLYPAFMDGRQRVRIVPRIEGYLQKIQVKEGEHVKRGQTLFVLDQANYRAELGVAKSNVDAAKAGVENAQLSLESKQILRNKNIISEFELRQAEINLKMAEAQLSQSQAQLESVQTTLSYTILKSPCDGVVGRLPYSVGDYIGPAITDGLTTVADTSEMYIYFSMAERDVVERVSDVGSMQKWIESFPQVTLRLTNQSEYMEKGHIESISGIVDSQTGALQVRAVFPNPDGILLSGGTGSLVIPEVYSQAIVIPQEATYEILNKIYVYRMIDGRAKSTIVDAIPMSDGQHYVITGGLKEGDIIVAKGAGYIKENTWIDAGDGQNYEYETVY